MTKEQFKNLTPANKINFLNKVMKGEDKFEEELDIKEFLDGIKNMELKI